MHDVSKLNLKISAGDPSKPRKYRRLTMQEVIEWIKSKNCDEKTTCELIKVVSKYPENALLQFKKTFNNHLAAIHKKNSDDTKLGYGTSKE